MIARIKKLTRKQATPKWHPGFLKMLPTIRRYALAAFGHFRPEARQDLVQEVVANATAAYKRLYEQGKVDLAYPTVLAMYGIKQVKDGRRVGAKLNIKDVSSEYAQKKKGFKIQRLDKFDQDTGEWCEILLEDRRAPDVSGQVQ